MSDSLTNRRSFLQAAGVGLALPMLESIGGAAPGTSADGTTAQRFVAVGTYLGFHTPSWFPSDSGADYESSAVLAPLDRHRKQFSLFSGLDHRAANGHSNWWNYLVGPKKGEGSLDQWIAGELGEHTRFSSLQLTCGAASGNGAMNFTREGVALPMIGRPSVLYGKLFSSDSDKARQRYLLESNRSVLDLVQEDARALDRRISTTDREKLNEYFTSVRDVEKRLQKRRAWLERPTPTVEYELPEFDPVAPDLSLECESIVYDLMLLALETDSTRVITLLVPGAGQVFTLEGEKLSSGYHGLSHHGQDPAKIAEFNRIGRAHVTRFGRLLDGLAEKRDAAGRSLLDSTIVLYGSGMGDANTHDNSRLPVLVAGGGMKHGRHHTIERGDDARPTPLLGDLYLTLMQRLGIERDRFANASRNMNEFLL